MARPKIPSQKEAYSQLRGRINQYTLLVQKVYDQLNKEVASMVTRLGYDGSKPFRFSDYPQTSKAVRDLQEKFVGNLHSVIYTSTSREWKESNLLQDLVADKAMKFYGIKTRKDRIKKYYQTNSDALKAFQERKDKGLNLSQKLWNQSEDYKKEMECAISSAVQKGTSAIALSKRLSKYLNDFPSLKADYGKRFGKARDVKDCEYRSIRLARTEINMAYRTAEQKRWEQFDFVIGYEVKLSGGHNIKDICDFAKGKYPKKFKFKGWHPNCFCYVIPILKSEDEFWDESGAPCPSEVTDTPAGFKDWLKDNSDRLSDAKKKGTLPYWAEENTDYVFDKEVKPLEFVKCKTIAEYADLASKLPFVGSISFVDCSLKSAEDIVEQMYSLQSVIPAGVAKKVDIETFFSYSGDAELGTFSRWGGDKIKTATNATRVVNRQIAKQEASHLKTVTAQHQQLLDNIETVKRQIAEAIEEGYPSEWIDKKRDLLSKAEGWVAQSEAKVAEARNNFTPNLYTRGRNEKDVFTHEFGHYVNDLLQTQWDEFPAPVHSAMKKMCAKAGVPWNDARNRPDFVWQGNKNFFDTYMMNANAFKVSQYASTEGCEFFAESFLQFVQEGKVEDAMMNELFNALFKK